MIYKIFSKMSNKFFHFEGAPAYKTINNQNKTTFIAGYPGTVYVTAEANDQ